MFTSKVVPRLSLLRRASCSLQANADIFNRCGQPILSTNSSLLKRKSKKLFDSSRQHISPRWVQLEPELEDALVPRKLSVSPLESWLSLRYSLPPLVESAPPQEDAAGLLEEKVLPPLSVPVMEDGGEGSAMPLSCKNVLEIRRRKMNRHKYKKLLKRTKFLRRRVMEGRGKKKQKRFEEDLKRIWTRAGLKKAPEGWTTPKIFIKQHGNKRD